MFLSVSDIFTITSKTDEMGNTTSQSSKKQKSTIKSIDEMTNDAPRTVSLSSIPNSITAASLSCLAAEYHQIRDQNALDTWKIRASQTIGDLYEQRASLLRHEEQMKVVLEQLRMIINEGLPRQPMLDNIRLCQTDLTMNHQSE